MTISEPGLFDGLELKRRGLDRIEENHPTTVARLRELAKSHSLMHGSVTMDDVRLMAESADLEVAHPNVWGAVFRGRGWRQEGTIRSQNPAAHGRPIGVWVWEER